MAASLAATSRQVTEDTAITGDTTLYAHWTLLLTPPTGLTACPSGAKALLITLGTAWVLIGAAALIGFIRSKKQKS